MMITRRNTLMGLATLLGALLPQAPARAARAYEVTHTEDEWKKLLTADQFYVLRKAGTERPYTHPLNKEKRAGTYACAGCALPLFSSKAKFESGTGWPSFYEPLSKNAVVEETDSTFGMRRTE